MPLPDGFIDLNEVIPRLKVDLRYLQAENFVGRPIPGYQRNCGIMTVPAAEALARAWQMAERQGYELVVYDAYRPQQAVESFKVWSADANDVLTRARYYPRADKTRFFEIGYISAKSAHTRGSTVDLTLLKKGTPLLEKPRYETRHLSDGYAFQYVNDGTVDMGTAFDFMDVASHRNRTLISTEQADARDLLRHIMEEAGFASYAIEWWHFWLRDEPFPATYFDFPIA